MDDILKEMNASIQEQHKNKKRVVSTGVTNIKHYKRRVTMTKTYSEVERMVHSKWGINLDEVRSKVMVVNGHMYQIVEALYRLVPKVGSMTIARSELNAIIESVTGGTKYVPSLSVVCKWLRNNSVISGNKKIMVIHGELLHKIEQPSLIKMLKERERKYRKELEAAKEAASKASKQPTESKEPSITEDVKVVNKDGVLEVTITCKGTLEQIERFYNNLKLRG